MKGIKSLFVAAIALMLAIPANALEVGKTYDKDNVTYVVTASDVVAVKGPASSSYTGAITIPATVKLGGVLGIGATECTVTAIQENAFKNAKISSCDMSSATNLTTISPYAFAFNSSITTVKFPSSGNKITVIPEGLFYDCTKLATIENLPAYLTTIGYSAFRGTAITAFTVPATVTSIARYAFADNSSLNRFICRSSSITEIPDGTFNYCSSLRYNMLTFNGTITKVGESAFWGCTALTAVPEVLSNVTSWGDRCFKNATGIEEVTIADNVTYVGYDCFNGCSSLKKVYSNIANPGDVYNNDLRLGQGMFKNANSANVRFYVPVGSEEVYHSGVAADVEHLIAVGTLAEVLDKGIVAGDNDDFTYHYLLNENYDVATTVYDTNAMKPYILIKDNDGYTSRSEADGRPAYPVAGEPQAGDYDQSNWMAVSVNWSQPFIGKQVRANTLTFTLTDKQNPTAVFTYGFNTDSNYDEITTPSATGSSDYEPNVYWPANFIYQDDYFFVDPKPLEYAKVANAVYSNGAFYMADIIKNEEEEINPQGLKGAVAANTQLLESEEEEPLKENYIYEFTCLVVAKDTDTAEPIGISPRLRNLGDPNESMWEVYPIEILSSRELPENTVDGIEAINTDGKTIGEVQYINAAGQRSAVPFDGLNIVVIRYTDGTTDVQKTVKR